MLGIPPVPGALQLSHKGDSSPSHALSWSFLCFRHALRQDTALSVWDGFGGTHIVLSQWGMDAREQHPLQLEQVLVPVKIKWDETLVPQQRVPYCSACLGHGQQNFLFGIWFERATRLWPQWERADAGPGC